MPNIMEVVSSTIRGGLCAEVGHKLVAADLSNIEGRTLAWLAGEEWKLQAFRDYDAGKGDDLYLVTAGGILGKSPKEVTKQERQAYGKTPELACGFGGGVGAFQNMARVFGMDMPDAQAKEIVKGWRKKHPKTTALWYDLEDAVKRAVQHPGMRIECGKLVIRRDGTWLRIRLPSGRFLCYPGVRIDKAECWECKRKTKEMKAECPACGGTATSERDQVTYMGTNQYTRRWERISTYSGKLAENVTQAVARDVIAHNMPNVEDEGYLLVLSVHDELVCETLDIPSFTSDRLCQLLSAVPFWAQGLPLKAEGFEASRYRK